ncbi:MAG: ABC transporter ATP-binding protein/permease [Oscillospiraceae bacterium]
MLKITEISKTYVTGDLVQTALDKVSVNFRDNEFVAVLGQSGSGKTTLLNIVGGLDRYDSGDLVINGVSTAQYKDRDWDTYRNHAIGFVFQSYNLIPHQSVLSNVELALTISGVSKGERRRRAKEALTKVGLGDQLHKKPNQMSGGQMQRVAIARALVNNPDILLADEPTGALDSETSIQVMELLKEVAKDRLVIMVTHNPELAEQYANRIVRLRDGRVISDTNPFTDLPVVSSEKKKVKKASMSFTTALSLSLNNLRTKKARTILTSFAGSIGIIGIGLILSLSSGVQDYINTIQRDTLTAYPISIEKNSVDYAALMTEMMSDKASADHDKDQVYSNNVLSHYLATMSSATKVNDLGTFKNFLDNDKDIQSNVSAIQYGYDLGLQIYGTDTADGVTKLNPSELFGNQNQNSMMGTEDTENSATSTNQLVSGNGDVFTEMIDNQSLLAKQYDVLAGRLPAEGAPDEVVIVVDKNNEINDMALYTIGLMDQDEYLAMQTNLASGKPVTETPQKTYTYDEIFNTTFKLVLNTDVYQYNSDKKIWEDMTKDAAFMKTAVDNGLSLKIVGILRQNENAKAASISGTIAYTSALTRYVSDQINTKDIAKQQLADPTINVFTGQPFQDSAQMTIDDMKAYIETLPAEQKEKIKAQMASLTDEQLLALVNQQMKINGDKLATFESNKKTLGIVDLTQPSLINIYPTDFEAKDRILDLIDGYNADKTAAGLTDQTISYTDLMGLMMSSVTTMINMISYVLIGFVAISLVVSSIMIGIITFISVLQRTKEIGILRSIGASKRNISSIFNAETLIVGFISGVMGIGITLLLIIPANLIIEMIADVPHLAKLPWIYGVLLIVVSMVLTLIAGIIPSGKAAKRDPVAALRSE